MTAAASGAAGTITNGSKAIGGFIYTKAVGASTAVNGKISESEKLSKARDTTKEKLGYFSASISNQWTSLSSKLFK